MSTPVRVMESTSLPAAGPAKQPEKRSARDRGAETPPRRGLSSPPRRSGRCRPRHRTGPRVDPVFQMRAALTDPSIPANPLSLLQLAYFAVYADEEHRVMTEQSHEIDVPTAELDHVLEDHVVAGIRDCRGTPVKSVEEARPDGPPRPLPRSSPADRPTAERLRRQAGPVAAHTLSSVTYCGNINPRGEDLAVAATSKNSARG